MKEMNEDSIELFMKEQKQEVADRGFTKRVMRRLPTHQHSVTTFIDIALIAVCVCLFLVLGGLGLIHSLIGHVMAFVQTHTMEHLLSDPKLLITCAIIIVSLTITYFYTTEES